MTPDRRAAFTAERAEMLAFCATLAPAEWRMNSLAEGWRVQDVVAHLGTGCHAVFNPARRNSCGATISSVPTTRWSIPAGTGRRPMCWPNTGAGAGFSVRSSPPRPYAAGRGVEASLAELGKFPVRILLSALVFDQHTHLRHDMAPALGRPAPGTDANRIAVVLEWMMAVLSNQLRAQRSFVLGSTAVDYADRTRRRHVAGGTRRLGHRRRDPTGRRADHRRRGEFPKWGTARTRWRDADVSIAGDADYAAAFLDTVDIV